MPEWKVADRLIAGDGRPRVMGIVNVTPDSFSDGGRFLDTDTACAHALGLVSQGANIIDIGGESSRPGAVRVALEEERRRVLPVIESLAGSSNAIISIDTAKPEIAREAVSLGASIVNDVGGLRDARMRSVVAETGAAVVIMHMRGTPETMQDDPRYEDVITEVYDYLANQVERARTDGIARERIAIDPGIGFGKRSVHNLALLRGLDRLNGLGCAIVVGTSRKRILGALTDKPVEERLVGSVVSALAAIERGASVVRVHDVSATLDAIKIWRALMNEPLP